MPKATLSHPIDAALGTRIRLCRVSAGMSQEQLASEVGLSPQQVQKYERGHNRISVSRLVEIAKALDIGVIDLLTPIVGDGKMSPARARLLGLLDDPDAVRVLTWLQGCTDPKLRSAVLALLELIG